MKRKASGFPAAKHESQSAVLEIPDPHEETYAPFVIDTPGAWGQISDIHCPYHDRETLKLFVREARRRRAVGVLLNGDTLDCHEATPSTATN